VLVPNATFAPVPRLMLFFLSSAGVSILLGAEASTKFRMKLPGFFIVTTSTAALAFGFLMYLTSAIKPELQVAIYDVFDEDGKEAMIDWDGAIELREVSSGRPGFFVAKRNRLVVTFPELVP